MASTKDACSKEDAVRYALQLEKEDEYSDEELSLAQKDVFNPPIYLIPGNSLREYHDAEHSFHEGGDQNLMDEDEFCLDSQGHDTCMCVS